MLTRSDVRIALLIAAAGLLLYVATLAPTVTWGDDATLQLAAVHGDLHASAGSHPSWVALAHLLSQLPGREPAYWINFTSAIAAAGTLGLLFLVLRILGLAVWPAATGVLAFAVSHTFWAHAVRTEVYTLAVATQVAVLWIALLWYRSGKVRYLPILGLALGIAITTHLLVVLYLPAIAWLLWTSRSRLNWRRTGLFLLGAVLALLPLAVLAARDARENAFDAPGLVRWVLFTFNGYDFGAAMLKGSAAGLPRDLVEAGAFLTYQFVGLAILLGLVGIRFSRDMLSASLCVFVGLLYVVPAFFALLYNVGDRYVFFLPSYVAVAIWIGIGAAQLQRWLARRGTNHEAMQVTQAALVLAILCVPVVVYRVTPDIMAGAGFAFRNERYVPGPSARYFLLWPPKAGYDDARVYAEAALSYAPKGALILADPVLASPLMYLQVAENQRPDVEVRFCCWDIDEALAAAAGRPVVLADDWTAIYPIERLRQRYSLVPRGPLILLQ